MIFLKSLFFNFSVLKMNLPIKMISYIKSTRKNKKLKTNRMKIELSAAEILKLEEAKQES